MEQEQKEKIKAEPRDVFLELVAMITLYVSAGSFLSLLFHGIDIFFPDALEGGYYNDGYSAIRWAIASLIIVFSAYIFIIKKLHNEYRANEKRYTMRIRKWLLYFTISLTACVMGGDIIAVIFHFLNGELTTRFILKALSVLIVAGYVFWYYTNEIKSGKEKNVRWLAYSAMILVWGGIIGGFFVAGSPQKERARRFDDERVNNLQFLQSEILFYWQNKKVLPEQLDLLNDDLRGVRVPHDPETAMPYEYVIQDQETFSLCATFNTENTNAPQSSFRTPLTYPSPETSWTHSAGKVCFDRHIDKEIYGKKIQ